MNSNRTFENCNSTTSKDINEEIEFFIPNDGLDLQSYLSKDVDTLTQEERRLRKQAIHHLARYYWAIRVLENMPPGLILDIACGSGYGSYLLASRLPRHKIIGGDYDQRSKTYAKKFGEANNLSYRTMDIVSWMNLDSGTSMGEFDYIVCFDTLEHLLHREIALINIVENICDKGVFLFSTPSGRKENLLNPGWEHHKIEYAYNYLYNLMSRFFKNVLIPDNNSLPNMDFWSEVNKNNTEYYLKCNPIFCSNPIKYGLIEVTRRKSSFMNILHFFTKKSLLSHKNIRKFE